MEYASILRKGLFLIPRTLTVLEKISFDLFILLLRCVTSKLTVYGNYILNAAMIYLNAARVTYWAQILKIRPP